MVVWMILYGLIFHMVGNTELANTFAVVTPRSRQGSSGIFFRTDVVTVENTGYV